MVMLDNRAQKVHLNAINDSLNICAANTAVLFVQTNAMTPIINQIGMRVNNLDNQTANILQLVTPVSKSGFQGCKSNFTPNGYSAELAFFKTLSSADKSDYLNMSKEAKRIKYSARKLN
jgi:hypothetical protein